MSANVRWRCRPQAVFIWAACNRPHARDDKPLCALDTSRRGRGQKADPRPRRCGSPESVEVSVVMGCRRERRSGPVASDIYESRCSADPLMTDKSQIRFRVAISRPNDALRNGTRERHAGSNRNNVHRQTPPAHGSLRFESRGYTLTSVCETAHRSSSTRATVVGAVLVARSGHQSLQSHFLGAIRWQILISQAIALPRPLLHTCHNAVRRAPRGRLSRPPRVQTRIAIGAVLVAARSGIRPVEQTTSQHSGGDDDARDPNCREQPGADRP